VRELALQELALRELALRELALRELALRELALRELALRELALRELALRELVAWMLVRNIRPPTVNRRSAMNQARPLSRRTILLQRLPSRTAMPNRRCQHCLG